MDIIKQLQEELEIGYGQAKAAVELIDEGNTIPFIARYRKEVTGSLNDEVLRKLDERLKYLRNLEERKAQVLATIEEQGQLTEELRAAIEAAPTLVMVEDLYRPYRPKRRTRATMAKEKGLETLADLIWDQKTAVPLLEEAAKYMGISMSYLYKLTMRQQIPFYKPMGKMCYFNRHELEEWLQSNRVSSSDEISRKAQLYCMKKGGAL